MDSHDTHDLGGSLRISTEVVEKIARHASMEVEGVYDVAPAAAGARMILDRIVPSKPINVNINSDVADIEVSLIVKYGTKIPELSEQVQRNVKEAVQNMTSISVARVDVVVAGVVA